MCTLYGGGIDFNIMPYNIALIYIGEYPCDKTVRFYICDDFPT